ncbi:MAG: tRNA 4-thiouridine(8) synthase ThiI [Bacteroides sp.]|nr:tRNA 4-thiouridine(8) synthase ThiI [Bacillota bacterium]MCM1455829.1 tRNA 4-thiouridine(8) synthase ThiI [Bacteroides sp.]
MDRVIIIRYGEIFLKGKNKSYFESLLINNIKHALKNFKYEFSRSQARYTVSGYDVNCEEEIIDKLKKVFGIHSLSVADRAVCDYQNGFSEIADSVKALTVKLVEENTLSNPTFRMTVKRADKHIPMKSFEIAAMLAEHVLQNSNFKVNLTDFDYEIYVDIRENGFAYVYSDKIAGAGGLPVGCSSKGLLLLSGGIDSPVAGYMMAKRGMKQLAIHFASPPYTSERATAKVAELRDIISPYTAEMPLYIVPFTEIQLEIHEKCPAEFMITIMRRFMMRIATVVAKKEGCLAIITGESLGQVASQTVESMTSTESCAGLPIFRPLIAFDKEETMALSEKIGTYEISIQPFEDCCTIFLPKNPSIHPNLKKVEEAERKLDIEALVERAIAGIEKR